MKKKIVYSSWEIHNPIEQDTQWAHHAPPKYPHRTPHKYPQRTPKGLISTLVENSRWSHYFYLDNLVTMVQTEKKGPKKGPGHPKDPRGHPKDQNPKPPPLRGGHPKDTRRTPQGHPNRGSMGVLEVSLRCP